MNVCLFGKDDKTLGREDSFSSHEVCGKKTHEL